MDMNQILFNVMRKAKSNGSLYEYQKVFYTILLFIVLLRFHLQSSFEKLQFLAHDKVW